MTNVVLLENPVGKEVGMGSKERLTHVFPHFQNHKVILAEVDYTIDRSTMLKTSFDQISPHIDSTNFDVGPERNGRVMKKINIIKLDDIDGIDRAVNWKSVLEYFQLRNLEPADIFDQGAVARYVVKQRCADLFGKSLVSLYHYPRNGLKIAGLPVHACLQIDTPLPNDPKYENGFKRSCWVCSDNGFCFRDSRVHFMATERC